MTKFAFLVLTILNLIWAITSTNHSLNVASAFVAGCCFMITIIEAIGLK